MRIGLRGRKHAAALFFAFIHDPSGSSLDETVTTLRHAGFYEMDCAVFVLFELTAYQRTKRFRAKVQTGANLSKRSRLYQVQAAGF